MVDYQSVLADLRGRLVAIDHERQELLVAIAAIERISGASGSGVTPKRGLFQPETESTANGQGAAQFKGLTMPAALGRHFIAVGAPQTVRQIVDALRSGGFEGGQNLRGHVYNTLHRLQSPKGPYLHDDNGTWTMIQRHVGLASF